MKYFLTIFFVIVVVLNAQDDLNNIYFPGDVIYDSYIQYTESSGDEILDVQLIKNNQIIDIDITFESKVESSPDVPYPYVKGNFVLNIPEDFQTDKIPYNIRTIYKVADTLISDYFYILDEFNTSVVPLFPYSNETEVSLYPEFSWQPEELEHLGPYWLEVFSDEECTQKVLGMPVIENKTEIYQKLNPETQYFWRVRSSAGIEPLYLDTFAFTTGYDHNWAILNDNKNYSFKNMHINNENNIFIVNENAVYRQEYYAAGDWSEFYKAPDNSELFDIVINNEQYLIPVKNSGDTLSFMYSSDAGETWSESDNKIFIGDVDYRIAQYGASILLGSGIDVYLIEDFGMSDITHSQIDNDLNISKIYNTSDNIAYIIAGSSNKNNSKVYSSENGTVWNEIDINTNILNTDITELPDNSLYISANKGSEGYLYYSESGKDWEEKYYMKGKPYISIESDSNGIIYLFTNNLRDSLYFSENLGESFSSQKIPYNNFVVENTNIDRKGYVYVYNSRGVLLRKKLNPIPEGIIYPADTAVIYNDVNIKWLRNYSAEKYQLQISEEKISGIIAGNLTDNSYIINDSTILTNSYRTNVLKNSRDYFWRVRSKLNDRWSDWSKAFKFTTDLTNAVTDNSEFYISIYPNPATENINISIPNVTSFRVKILNLSGINIIDKEVLGDNISIDTKSFASGVYIVNIYCENAVYSEEILLSK